MTAFWSIEFPASTDWRMVDLRPAVTFKVTLFDGRAEICFGLFSCHMNSTPRALEVGAPRFSVTSEHERFLYVRGKGRVKVEEVD